MGLLSSHYRGIGPHFTLNGESHGFSQFAEGSCGLLSSCVGHLGIHFESLQGNRASSRVEAGNSGFF